MHCRVADNSTLSCQHMAWLWCIVCSCCAANCADQHVSLLCFGLMTVAVTSRMRCIMFGSSKVSHPFITSIGLCIFTHCAILQADLGCQACCSNAAGGCKSPAYMLQECSFMSFGNNGTVTVLSSSGCCKAAFCELFASLAHWLIAQ